MRAAPAPVAAPWPPPPPPPPAAPTTDRRPVSLLLTVLLTTAVALAFADASVVVLGLPDIYADFDTTIVGVSWVITAYAIAVAATGALLLLGPARLRPLPVTVIGTAMFVAASLAAGVAPDLTPLLVARVVQGAGAALLLGGSLPVLASLRGSAVSARSLWAAAGTFGAAAGPALGGLLTQLFDWRAIFFVQAPVAAAALIVVASPTARAARADGARESTAHRPGSIAANFGFLLLFAAAVGALFLAVLCVVEVWRFEPLAGAAVVSSLPVAAIAVRPLVGHLPAPPRLVAGVVALASGLLGLAFLPAAGAGWLAAAMAACGAGFGLVADALDPRALGSAGRLLGAGTLTTTARHAGLVLGLALVAPVLAGSLERGAEDAALRGVATMLDARLRVDEKVSLAWDLRTVIDDTPDGQVPDVDPVFAERGVADDPALQRVQTDLNASVEGALTRAFRPAFLIAAGLGAAVIVPGLLAVRRRGAPRAPTAGRSVLGPAVALTAIVAGSVALVAVELGQGARDFGAYQPADACTTAPTPYPGDGVDAAIQRIALGALNGAACELETSRERLVLSLDPDADADLGGVTWDRPTAEAALRAGAHRAIDDGVDRDSLPGWAAIALRFIVDRAPIDWLLERTDLPG